MRGRFDQFARVTLKSNVFAMRRFAALAFNFLPGR